MGHVRPSLQPSPSIDTRRFRGGHDAAMDRYAYMLAQLRCSDFTPLQCHAADGRSAFTTWLVVVARRLCLDHRDGRLTGGTISTVASVGPL